MCDPTGGLLTDSPSSKAEKYAKKSERDRQAAINTGMANINASFAGYTPDFYQQRADAFLKYALPQLGQQYQQARNQTGFALANRGLTNSSQASNRWSQLARNTEQSKQNLVDQSIQQKQDLQRQVEGLKQGLIGQLYTTADPSQSAQQTASTIASISQPSQFPIIGNMFNDLLNQYTTAQIINAYKQPMYYSTPDIPNAGYAQTPVTFNERSR